MSVKKRRTDLLAALVGGSVVANDSGYTMILFELNEVYRVHSVEPPRRRYLLQVLHGTRALDSTLKVFVAHHGCPVAGSALGPYLTALANHRLGHLGNLPENSRKRFMRSIVDRRNRYMHEAGAMPATEQEISIVISEMESCLSMVLSL